MNVASSSASPDLGFGPSLRCGVRAVGGIVCEQAVSDGVLQCPVKGEMDIPHCLPAETSVCSDGSGLFEVSVHGTKRLSVEVVEVAVEPRFQMTIDMELVRSPRR
jgi:hypothetical protein